MPDSTLRLVLGIALLLAPLSPAQEAAVDTALRVHYTLMAGGAEGDDPGRFTVAMEVMGLAAGDVVVAIPAWKPGAYRIEKWNELIDEVGAAGVTGAELTVEKTGPREWTIRGDHGGRATVRYRSRTVRASKTWMSLEGPPTWLYVRDGLRSPSRVTIEVPDGWKIATGLAPTEDTHTFTAPDYDTLADCPIELGELTIDRFEEGDRAYFITYNEQPRFERKEMIEQCRKIVQYQTGIFGGAPFERYYFMWHLQARQDFFGGLEHLNSTTLQLPQFLLRRNLAESTASLVAHEFFHLWNVKRIRPFGLGPFDYTQPVPVRGLWFSEGVTDFYADATCVRTGLWSPERYLVALATELTSLRNDPAYGRESVEEASLGTWERPFGQGGLDYYNAGKQLGLLLDIEIRHATNNERSLDDVMVRLQAEFGLPKPGFRDADLVAAVSQVAGTDLAPWFSRYVAGRDDFPFEETAAKAGLEVVAETRHRRDTAAMGELFPDVVVENEGEGAEERWTVVQVGEPTESPFEKGDVVLRFGDREPRAASGRRSFVGRNLRRASTQVSDPDQPVKVHVLRAGQELELDVAVPFTATHRYRVVEAAQADPLQTAIRDALLGRKTKRL